MLSSSKELTGEKKTRRKVRKRKRILKKRDFPSQKVVFIDGKSFHASANNEDSEKIPNDFVPVTPGMRWKCLMCGRCCNGNWQINLTWKEYDRLKDDLPIETVVLDEFTGASHPYFRITGSCPAFNMENHKCIIYNKKVYTCNAFPFLIDLKNELHITKSCEGFGHGPYIDIDEKITELIKLKLRAGMKGSFHNNSTQKNKTPM